uniref:Uncharacterized protein n=1 Tax=Pyxicephalus adspersus TaxID=30357 RepID=A0AAV2ZHK9_PYXAD|nr:TPA: hypothetical protein GDO54_002487 [Pyxicephalus adspersus]
MLPLFCKIPRIVFFLKNKKKYAKQLIRNKELFDKKGLVYLQECSIYNVCLEKFSPVTELIINLNIPKIFQHFIYSLKVKSSYYSYYSVFSGWQVYKIELLLQNGPMLNCYQSC